jgi:hypothetical protein
MMQNVVREVLAADHLARLAHAENFVGWVYSIDYESAQVMTNDLWKADVGGVPQNCFLTAAPFLADAYASTAEDDRYVLLLRVVGTTRLPATDDLIATRIDHFQRQRDRTLKALDDITQNQLQHGGLACHVLGTFYVGHDGELRLGSDIESFAAAGDLYVFRPRGQALATIVNFLDPDTRQRAQRDLRLLQQERHDQIAQVATSLPAGADVRFRLGTVRYTSTDRLHRGTTSDLVPVYLQAADFLARRTAVFGMTRSGKSNTIKHVVSAVKEVADKIEVPIGQLLFDLRGEYASANLQDPTEQGQASSLADAFPGETVRYRTRLTPGFQVILNNFYLQLQEGLAVIQEVIRDDANASAIDVQTFLQMSLDEPDAQDRSLYSRWQVKAAAYQAMLHKAGFPAPAGRQVRFNANQQVRTAVAPYFQQRTGRRAPDPSTGLTLDDAVDWFECARRANRVAFPQPASATGTAASSGAASSTRSGGRSQTAGMPGGLLRSSTGGEWLDAETSAILNMLVQRNAGDTFIRGLRVLDSAREYHSPARTQAVEQEVYDLLKRGKIVIIDLSVGPAFIRDKVSQRIARHLFNRSQEIFLKGRMPPTIVVYVEEAHNLINRKAELTETWPTIAKEGAKFRIGLVYATQEPSTIHPNILSNTENWVVTHLNNDDELSHLGKFYDFADFTRSLKNATDVGFARIRTLSAKFVVPVHVDKFDPDAIVTRRSSSASGRSGSTSSDGGRDASATPLFTDEDA